MSDSAPPDRTRDAAPNRVMATLTHELRTPLNGIIGTASLLADTRLTASQSAYVAAIRQSASQLLDLLNNALDFARLAEGALYLEAAPVPIAELVQDVCELLAPRAHAKGLDLAARIDADVPDRIIADGTRLRQVLFNLIGNAIKFTDEGGVLVDISQPEPGRTSFAVCDTGPGIPPGARERIFEAFGQIGSADARREAGVGLGLAIVRMLADAMHAEIRCESEPGAGACFRFILPVAESVTTDRPAPAGSGEVSLAGLSPITALAAVGALARAGAGAVNLCEGEVPGAVRLTLADARIAPSWMQALARSGPVIVVLRPEDRAMIPKFRDMGCAGYLVRPIRPASLIERLGLARVGAQGATDPLSEDAAPNARVLVADDNAINALIARRALEKSGFSVSVVSTGSEAVEAVGRDAYDLVFMDLRMPIMDGFEAMRRMRARGYAGLPIVAISAEVDPDIERRAREAGADAVASKPLDADTLRRIAVKWTRSREGNAA